MRIATETWAVLARLEDRQVMLALIGDHLRYRAPKGQMSQDLIEAVSENGGELMDLLTMGEPGTYWDAEVLGACYTVSTGVEPPELAEATVVGFTKDGSAVLAPAPGHRRAPVRHPRSRQLAADG